ncbi:MAG: nucleotidyltransferase domain-containing protein [Coriobacteriia bacterium]|nr:nucleotidyltransferase domain-containing protein [Coriobacteriia bacterium]MCL2750564.1 nucleotidyltransferase domain-containing protein [Coriobacteriia bacterium]
MNILESNELVFGSRSGMRVLRVLAGVSVPLSVTQIAQHAHLSYPAVNSVLVELVNRGIVLESRSGNARIHQLNQENIYVEQIIAPFFQLENNVRFEMIVDIKAAFSNLALSVILFGSFSRGTQTLQSDVDILIVSKDEGEKTLVEEKLSEYTLQFYRRFGHTLEALNYTIDEARELHNRAPGLFQELEVDGYVVFGNTDWMNHV